MNLLENLLLARDYLLADGAMGSMLMTKGLAHGNPPEEWNLLHPGRVRAVHRSYIEAGSQIILTNSFGGTRFRLKLHQLQDRVKELNCTAARLARAEVDAAPRPVAVAGSIGPSGEILDPLGDLSFEEARDGFAEQAAALAGGGVDVLWVETMSDLNEVRAAVEGARLASALPLVVTMTFDTHGHTMMGVSPARALEALREFDPMAMGGNCGNGPAEIEGVIQDMYAADQALPLVAKSNAGIPELVNGVAVYNATPEVMARYAVRVRDFGARIIGACCGSTPAHIRAMAEALQHNDTHRAVVLAEPPEMKPRMARERKHRRRGA